MSDLEKAAQALGIDISDTPPTDEPQVEDTATETPVEEFAQEEVQEDVQEEVQEDVQQEQGFDEPVAEQQVEDTVEDSQSSLDEEDSDVSEQELYDMAVDMVGEMLGYENLSIQQLQEILNTEPQEATPQVDERLQPILDFVEKTGRSPEDWFRYQQLNPTEMDDLSAVRLNIQTEYPDLTASEVDRLMNRKYKLDESRFDADEVADSMLQLKIDASKARQDISSLRDGFMAPVESANTQGEIESPFDDAWYSSMESETASLEALDFDLPGGKGFRYGIRDDYRQQLVDKNSRLEEFFDQYVNNDGSWDYDLLNSHQAVVDNIDEIVKSVYQQGISDGQRKVVSNASNVQANTPTNTPQQGGGQDAQMERLLRELGGGNKTMTIKGL